MRQLGSEGNSDQRERLSRLRLLLVMAQDSFLRPLRARPEGRLLPVALVGQSRRQCAPQLGKKMEGAAQLHRCQRGTQTSRTARSRQTTRGNHNRTNWAATHQN